VIQPAPQYLHVAGCHFPIVRSISDAEQSFLCMFQELLTLGLYC